MGLIVMWWGEFCLWSGISGFGSCCLGGSFAGGGKTVLETRAEACLMRATYDRYGERCWERVTRAERADEGKGNKSPPTWQSCLVKYG